MFPKVPLDGLLFLLLVGLAFSLSASARPITQASTPERKTSTATPWLLSLYYLIACALAGGPPALLILLGRPYDVYGFGLPYVHVLMLAFTGYSGVRALADFLESRQKAALVTYVVLMVWLAVIASRGAVSFLVFASLLLLASRVSLTPKRFVGLGGTGIAFLFGFGLFGDRRLDFQIAQETGRPAAAGAILAYSKASAAFLATGLPATLMWAYLYVASPVANLFSAFEYSDGSVCGRDCNIPGLVFHTLLPDVIGSRLASFLDVPQIDKSTFLIQPDLTASTTFGSAVGYAGLLGAVSILAALLLIAGISLSILVGSDLQASGLALLGTFLFFCFFENMISYTPLSLQLAFCVGLAHRHKMAPKPRVSRRGLVWR
ncbi:hypothetical protein ACOCJ4_04575 [Knoellia sp. CPCC 206435]